MEHGKKNIVELTRCSVEGYSRLKKLPLAVMTDNVRSGLNIGSIFRTCDAFLAERVILAGISGTPPHPEISKTALGAEQSVEWNYAPEALAEVEMLKREGYAVCVLEQTHNSIPLQQLDSWIREPRGGVSAQQEEGCCGQDSSPGQRKFLLVVGNEVEGVDQRIVDIADVVIEIPQHGTKHSLNVAVSAAMAIWEFYKSLISLA